MIVDRHPYLGCRGVLATKHGKHDLIAPAMFRRLGLEIETAEVDTDVLGTFTREVPRPGSQLDVAVAKARLGMDLTGLSIGLASEGSIGPHWSVPLLTVDIELVVAVDEERGIVVAESEADLDVVAFGTDLPVADIDLLDLERAGFPEHGLIVMSTAGHGPIFKGIHGREELDDAVRRCFVVDPSAGVRVESDFRAHHHPTRRRVIARAADRLAERLSRSCPSCRAPGWGIGRQEGGAPCRECGAATRMIRSVHYVCARCEVEVAEPKVGSEGVDPQYCPRCNP